jgi:hypothetical protein
LKRNFKEMRELLNSTNGKYASVKFVKKDGSVRLMNIQPAKTKKHTKGDMASESAKKAVATRAAKNPNLYNVWDVKKQAIRSVNLETVQEINISGKKYVYK